MLRSEHRALGATASQAWHKVLRRPDRFVSVDSVYFEGEPFVREIDLELQLGRFGMLPEYPFTIAELNDFAAERQAVAG